jgi:hypothetical protein
MIPIVLALFVPLRPSLHLGASMHKRSHAVAIDVGVHTMLLPGEGTHEDDIRRIEDQLRGGSAAAAGAMVDPFLLPASPV